MENSILKKLQIKPGFKVKVINEPKNFSSIIGDVSADVEIYYNDKAGFDGLLIFAITKADY
ncbi:MAG: hypothetical protein EOO47_22975 [Flavobacterium sp.]|nr:MAG: hypothetical protein EOO47_22975 [Flavobacterium sp.]